VREQLALEAAKQKRRGLVQQVAESRPVTPVSCPNNNAPRVVRDTSITNKASPFAKQQPPRRDVQLLNEQLEAGRLGFFYCCVCLFFVVCIGPNSCVVWQAPRCQKRSQSHGESKGGTGKGSLWWFHVILKWFPKIRLGTCIDLKAEKQLAQALVSEEEAQRRQKLQAAIAKTDLLRRQLREEMSIKALLSAPLPSSHKPSKALSSPRRCTKSWKTKATRLLAMCPCLRPPSTHGYLPATAHSSSLFLLFSLFPRTLLRLS